MALKPEVPITEYRFASGAQRGSHLTLFPGRLVLDGGDTVEHMPLARLAAVRVAFEREPRKLRWAVIFLVLAVILNVVSGPLQRLAVTAQGEVVEHAKRESVAGGVPGVLRISFLALEKFAAALPPIGFVLGAWALALAALYWWGRTTLTLTLGAIEREFSVRGRDPMLTSFVDLLGTRLAELSG